MLAGLHGMIPGGVSVYDFEIVTGISTEDSKKILNEFVACGIGSMQDGSNDVDQHIDIHAGNDIPSTADDHRGSITTTPKNNNNNDTVPSNYDDDASTHDTNGTLYYFQNSDRLRVAIALLEKGFAIDGIADALDWKNFEGLTAEILSSQGFAVIKNLILTKPRMEIDIVAIRLGIAILIDCKHWKRYPTSSLTKAVNKQVERAKHYVAKTPGAIAVPVIVTLYHDKVGFIDNVPIVPIFQFSSFIEDLYGNIEQMKTIETG